MVLSNERKLTEQYAIRLGEAETRPAFGRSIEAANLPAF